MRTIPQAVWVDTTNLSATTRYYPVETNDASHTRGLLLEAPAEMTLNFDTSGGVTLTVEWCGHITGTNLTPDTGDWLDITDKGVPVDGSAVAASYVDAKDRLVFKLQPGRVRVKIITSDATNAVQIIAYVQHVEGGNIVNVGASSLPPGAATDANIDAQTGGDASAAADAAGNPTSGGLRSWLMAWNNASWDRVRSGLSAATATLTGMLNTIPMQLYKTTAPALTDGQVLPGLSNRDGSARINADCYDWVHQRHIVASTAAQQVACVRTPPTYPFDGLWVDSDGWVVFGQPRGRAYHIVDGLTFAAPASWVTAGTDWTIAGAKATHVPGAGTDDLIGTMGAPLVVGKTYLVYVKGTKTAGTSLTAYCGTAAGTAIAANGAFEFVQVLVCTGSSSCLLRATADFEGEVTHYQIYPHTPKLCAYTYNPFAMTEVLGAAAGNAMTVLLIGTTNEVHACYRRVPGAADLG